NYTKTAQRLFITQPAVTHHIKSLETEFDIVIFTGSKGFELTRQGQILVEYARRMINQSRELTEAITDSLSLKKNLALGVTNDAIALCAKKNLLSRLFEVYNSNAHIIAKSSAEIFADLKEGKLDFAIIDGPYDDDAFDGILLDTTNIVPICYTEGKFKEIKRVTRDMIKNNPIILGESQSGMCETTLSSLRTSNINVANVPTFHSNSFFLMGEIVKSKDGIGFMYSDLCEQLRDVKKMDLMNFKATQGIYLIYSQNSFDKPTLKALVKVLKKWKER
ncbi:MAG: LysR family transcriptional regulator, partial [Anaeroplasmataceae bacterium]|nr:LysR family transcriptional regulator [Anaeroplasmataceae bacterium]